MILNTAFKNFLYCLWVIFCSLSLVEIVLFFLAPAPSIELLNVTTANSIQYKLVENSKLLYIPIPNTGPLNSQGHRGKEFKTKDIKPRLTFLGDSVVEGYGVEPKERFTELLSEKINYEIINIGVRGYNIWQYLEYFKLKKIKTNRLAIGISYNDLTLHSGEINAFKEEISKLKKNGLYSFYYKNKKSIISKALKLNITRYAIALLSDKSSNAFDSKGLFNNAASVIDEFQEIAKKENIIISYIIFPINPNSYFDQQVQKIRQILINKKQTVLDLDRISQEKFSSDERKTWFLNSKDPCHFSTKGMEKISELILELGENTIF